MEAVILVLIGAFAGASIVTLMNISKKGREEQKVLLKNIQLSQESKEPQRKTGKII